ncbi:LPXTG cell wall anchor domain-containing protein [Paenibacillus sp. R14(2021)]|uniref:LPXTG cell wall anchor domain-containing protein n=1 Tax=Paenibacillus sp. R14(2021) TaxID=2859228 RepID=UPI002157D02A|nr:LPXTG cell wall anchor domain-containing protein [Paenibacillus sp. R14(2021)]
MFIDITVGDVPLGTIDTGSTLPKTGEESHLNVRLAGLFVILLGVFLLRKRLFRSSK